ncbi:rRNA maturation RNase YbeY [bacterium]|nr:rRNA maturation RNase YbeY [bacterium]
MNESQSDDCELDLSIVSDKEIQELNAKYLQHEGPTDVISFSQRENIRQCDDEETSQLGDVVVSADRALEQAENFNTNFNDEFGLYIIHGILHLLGYDDIDIKKKIIMEKQQNLWFNTILKKNNLVLISA